MSDNIHKNKQRSATREENPEPKLPDSSPVTQQASKRAKKSKTPSASEDSNFTDNNSGGHESGNTPAPEVQHVGQAPATARNVPQLAGDPSDSNNHGSGANLTDRTQFADIPRVSYTPPWLGSAFPIYVWGGLPPVSGFNNRLNVSQSSGSSSIAGNYPGGCGSGNNSALGFQHAGIFDLASTCPSPPEAPPTLVLRSLVATFLPEPTARDRIASTEQHPFLPGPTTPCHPGPALASAIPFLSEAPTQQAIMALFKTLPGG